MARSRKTFFVRRIFTSLVSGDLLNNYTYNKTNKKSGQLNKLSAAFLMAHPEGLEPPTC
jgi:hypothetical protein